MMQSQNRLDERANRMIAQVGRDIANSQATIRRGQVVMRDGVVQAPPCSGKFIARGPYDMIRPRGVLPDGFDASAFA